MTVIKNTSRKKAFTLVELLVVISIIATLLAVLMPSLRKAREQAKRVYCLSNLRQMAIAANLYVNSNDQYFPISHWSDQVNGNTVSYSWDFTIKNIDGKMIVESGLLWQNETIEKVNQCPSYKGSSNWSSIDTYTGYNYNTSFIGHGQGESTAANYTGRVVSHPTWPSFYTIVMSARVGQVKKPENCVLFGDGQYSGGANKMMRSPFAWEGDRDISLKLAGTQGYRHDGSTNSVWADGHASSQSEIYTDSYNLLTNRPIDRIKTELENYNKTAKIKIGFLSPDNSAYDLN